MGICEIVAERIKFAGNELAEDGDRIYDEAIKNGYSPEMACAILSDIFGIRFHPPKPKDTP